MERQMIGEDLRNADEMTRPEMVEGYRYGEARLCAECGRPFEPGYWNQRYCCSECQNGDVADKKQGGKRTGKGLNYIPTADELTYNEEMRLHRSGHRERRCVLCGQVFTARVPNHKYCSYACRVEAHKRKRTWHECPVCGKRFQGTAGRRFCSAECGLLAQRLPRLVIFDRDGFRCIYCGRSAAEHGVALHVEHVIPVSDGGQSVAGNLVTSCWQCNMEKTARRLQSEDFILEEISKRNKAADLDDRQALKIKDRKGPKRSRQRTLDLLAAVSSMEQEAGEARC